MAGLSGLAPIDSGRQIEYYSLLPTLVHSINNLTTQIELSLVKITAISDEAGRLDKTKTRLSLSLARFS